MKSNLDGKQALVTGAASGIGLAIARDLATRGARITLVDLPGHRLDEAARSIDGSRRIGADLGSREELHRLVQDAGQVDVLINNAGIQHVSAVHEFPEEQWDRLLAIMLTAPFLLIRAFLPGMYERNWGRIVNIASVHGLVASPYKAAYIAAKHGLLGLTKTVALEAAERTQAITVNAVAPSYVRTPLVEKQIADQSRVHGIPESEVVESVLLTENAIKRLIEPEEVAETVAYLCSDAAWSTTGSVLTMDAGRLAH